MRLPCEYLKREWRAHGRRTALATAITRARQRAERGEGVRESAVSDEAVWVLAVSGKGVRESAVSGEGARE